jgi:peroxiredoxin
MNYLELPEGLPVPEDDGACDHLLGKSMPALTLPSTSGDVVNLADFATSAYIIYCYPLTGNPTTALPCHWDSIPGARGCTPQSLTFKFNYPQIKAAGFELFGLSSQSTAYQTEFANRMELPFGILSDEDLQFAQALNLPLLNVEGLDKPLIKRLTLIVQANKIVKVFYPIFPPTENADLVLTWIQENS